MECSIIYYGEQLFLRGVFQCVYVGGALHVSVDGVKAQSLALVAASEDGSIVGSPDYRRLSDFHDKCRPKPLCYFATCLY